MSKQTITLPKGFAAAPEWEYMDDFSDDNKEKWKDFLSPAQEEIFGYERHSAHPLLPAFEAYLEQLEHVYGLAGSDDSDDSDDSLPPLEEDCTGICRVCDKSVAVTNMYSEGKDYYDSWYICSKYCFDEDVLPKYSSGIRCAQCEKKMHLRFNTDGSLITPDYCEECIPDE